MAKIETKAWDAAEFLKTEEDITAYLEAALENDDSVLIAAVLGDIARAKGTGLESESLYKALSPEGNL